MRVIIEPDYEKLSNWAAEYVISKINAANPTAEKPFVLGLPTGSSPIGMYKALVKANKEGRVASSTYSPSIWTNMLVFQSLTLKATTLSWLPTSSTTLTVLKRTFTS